MIYPFNLEEFKAGTTPCRTMSGRRATYMHESGTLAPIYARVEELSVQRHEYDLDWSLENYTTTGEHLSDPEMNLIMDTDILYNEVSRSSKQFNDYLDIIHEKNLIEEAIEKSKHNNYYLF